MIFKRIAFLLSLVIIFFSYALVYSNFYKSSEIKFFDLSGKNIYLGNSKLNSTLVVFNSTIDVSDYDLHTNCKVNFDFIQKLNDYYFFNLTFLDDFCSNGNFYLKNGNDIVLNTNFNLNFKKESDLINIFTDYSSVYLNKLIEYYSEKKDKYKIFTLDKKEKFNYDFLKKERYFYEVSYKIEIMDYILSKRGEKYMIPIKGYSLPTLKTKLPNSPRPYRGSYTDGVHEGWDIDAPFRTEVVALDNSVVVKIVDNFKFSDLNNIKYSGNLTQEDKMKNLDILRGNQVWLKTMKGDVVFYAHLDEVYDNIKVGDIVEKGTPLGRVGITGVPDKNYSDYHLHFEVRKNSYNVKNAGKYSLLDYLKWDWYFKSEDFESIKGKQYNIFEK